MTSPVFERIACGRLGELTEQDDLQPYLPYLVSVAEATNSHPIYNLLHNYSQLNLVLSYVKVQSSDVVEYIQTELHPHLKAHGGVIPRVSSAEFEGCTTESAKMRLLVRELVGLVEYSKEKRMMAPAAKVGAKPVLAWFDSDILNNSVYLEELSAMLWLTLARCKAHINVPDVAAALLHINLSLPLIRTIVINDPTSFQHIVAALLKAAEEIDAGEKVAAVLLDLCTLSCYHAPHIRAALVARRVLPGLVFAVTNQHIHDDITFVNSILAANKPASYFDWLKDYVVSAQETNDAVLIQFRKELINSLKASMSGPRNASMTCRVLKALTGMVGLLGMRVTSPEVDAVLSCLSEPSLPLSLRTREIGLCFMVVCEGLTKLAGRSQVATALTAIAASAESDKKPLENGKREREGPGRGMLVLLATHLLAGLASTAAEVVRSVLGWTVAIHTESLALLAEIIRTEILPEEKLARELLSLPPSHTEARELEAAYHLLKAGIPQKHGVDPTPWIWSCILMMDQGKHTHDQKAKQDFAATTSITHTAWMKLLPMMIDIMVEATIDHNHITRVSDSQMRTLLTKPLMTSSHVLALYYLVKFNDRLQHYLRTKPDNAPPVNVSEYTPTFLSTIPVKSVLTHMQAHPQTYATILPSLVSLSVAHFPQFFYTPTLLLEYDTDTKAYTTTNTEMSLLSTPPRDVRTLSRPCDIIQHLCYLESLSDVDLIGKHSDELISTLLPKLLALDYSQGSGGGLMVVFFRLWQTVYTAEPGYIGPRTLLSFSVVCPDLKISSEVDPLVVLRVAEGLRANGSFDRVVLIMPIILQILASYMAASRRQIMTSHGTTKVDEAELSTLVLAQDSAVIQMLLEICVGSEKLTESEKAGLEEVRGLVCTFIHQAFIEQPLLAKLVHFQGYSYSLMPMVVANVPSMHICLGWLVELLNQPQIAKQVFAIYLAGYLVEKYPLPLSLPVAKATMAHIKILSQTWSHCKDDIASNKQHQATIVFPSVIRLCAAFPMLLEEALAILLDMTVTCPSQAMLDSINKTFTELFTLFVV